MCLPKEKYSLEEVADEWGWIVKDLLHCGWAGELELCVYIYGDLYIMCEEDWSLEKEEQKRKNFPTTFAGEKELLPEGLYPVFLLPGDWITPGQLGPKSFEGERITIKHPQKEAYTFLTKGEYDPSTLYITHKEKERFKATYELASGDDIKKKRPAQRFRSNELHDVIWRVYCDLEERHDAPTSGQVWQKLQRNYRKYDTEEIIDEITREIIVWTNYKGSRRTLKESSFKGTLSNIKKKKNISKNSN